VYHPPDHQKCARAFSLPEFTVDFYDNYFAEILGIAATVFLIDRLNRLRDQRHEEQQEKEALIHQMGSRDPTETDPAVRMLPFRGWLQDGTLQGARLSHANLSGMDLSDADLRGVNLQIANLQVAELMHVDLRGAILSGIYFYDADLTGADLRGVSLMHTSLTNATYRAKRKRGQALTGQGYGTLRYQLVVEAKSHIEASIRHSYYCEAIAIIECSVLGFLRFIACQSALRPPCP
jgi:hypothetical protein